MMLRKGTHRFLVILLAVVIVFALTSCGKLKISNLKANYYFTKANKLFEDGKFTEAIKKYELALENNPKLVEAYRFLGESYKSRYKPAVDTEENKMRAAKALEALNKAFEIDPINKEIIYSLGDMYDRMRDFDQAEKMYLKILDLEPGNMDNYYVVAEFYKRYTGERPELKDKAESMYLRRIETDPENPQGYAYIVNYYDNLPTSEHQGKFDKSVSFHYKRLELEPDNALIYYAIGVNRFSKAYQLQNVLSREEKIACSSESEKMLKKAIELDPNYPDSYAYMKILYLNVNSKIYPEREARLTEEANRFGEKFEEARKRQLDRLKLQKELEKTTG
ncbi:MAG: tetratricopeptide repeat protein [Candidatus Aminicenantales bacterium]